MRRLITFTSAKKLKKHPRTWISIPMVYFNINKIQYGTPYTWYMGFGFEEWENGRPEKLYCGYHDADMLVCIRIYTRAGCWSIYTVSVDGVATKQNGLDDYHLDVVVANHDKYAHVYD